MDAHSPRMNDNKPKEIRTVELEESQRLDRYLKQLYPFLSNQIIKKWIVQKGIKLEGKRTTKGTLVQTGDTLCIHDPTPLEQSYNASSTQKRVNILYEDQDIIALDKEAGIPSHPLHPWETSPILDTILEYDPQIQDIGEPRAPGLLHRLDNETSGVLLFARSKERYTQLVHSRASGFWRKEYAAWILGKPDWNEKTICSWIGHHPKNTQRMCVLSDLDGPSKKNPKGVYFRGKGQQVTTTIQVLKSGGWSSSIQSVQEEASQMSEFKDALLRYATPVYISIDKGVRHQIRVHLSSIGHPVLGDTLYPTASKTLPKELQDNMRLMLHAIRYTLPSPPLTRSICVESMPHFPFPDIPKFGN